jgi:hypothetical protein
VRNQQVWTAVLFAISPLLAACGPDSPEDEADANPSTCTAGQSRCITGGTYQTCSGGQFVTAETCTGLDVCAIGLGCVACDPDKATVCQGINVHSCNADGTIGDLVETCSACDNGVCTDECASGARLIYVVDDTYRLLSFNPEDDANTFTLIGDLNCPAGTSWPGYDPFEGDATPFSMAVDRDARAWVLYSDGQIFWVDTTSLACTNSGFSPGAGGYELFGMGFVAGSVSVEADQLFIAGGDTSEVSSGSGDLAYIDTTTLTPYTIGAYHPTSSDQLGPELTGTGDGNLYGYFPGTSTSAVARINRTTGVNEQTWSVPSPGSSIEAWAFAHWGGRFYIFVTADGDSQVWRLDPVSSEAVQILDNLDYKIVGAGVSTCAPFVVE